MSELKKKVLFDKLKESKWHYFKSFHKGLNKVVINVTMEYSLLSFTKLVTFINVRNILNYESKYHVGLDGIKLKFII